MPKKSTKPTFDIPERKPPPTPDLCPYCDDLCDADMIGNVSGSGVWRCDLCGHRWVAGYFYWRWREMIHAETD